MSNNKMQFSDQAKLKLIGATLAVLGMLAVITILALTTQVAQSAAEPVSTTPHSPSVVNEIVLDPIVVTPEKENPSRMTGWWEAVGEEITCHKLPLVEGKWYCYNTVDTEEDTVPVAGK